MLVFAEFVSVRILSHTAVWFVNTFVCVLDVFYFGLSAGFLMTAGSGIADQPSVLGRRIYDPYTSAAPSTSVSVIAIHSHTHIHEDTLDGLAVQG